MFWRNSADAGLGSTSVQLLRDGADDVLALQRTTNAQTFNIYNTFTSATNHERGFLKWSSNVFQIGTEKGSGGGTARALEFQYDGTTRVRLDETGFKVGAGATLGTSAQGALYIKAATGLGWPNLVLQTDSVANGATASIGFGVTTADASAAAHQIQALRRTSLAETDFVFLINSTERLRLRGDGLLQFQGTTSSFPALKRSTTTLQVRLADDSAFGALSCGALTLNGNLDASTRDIVTDTTTGTKIGTGTTQKIGFFNATPVVQQAAVADATDAASTQARLNDLLARLRTLGLIAT
jgi:hypothetical protein